MTPLAERKDSDIEPVTGRDLLREVVPRRGALRRFIRRLTRGSSDAEDIVQEAYLRLLERPPREREGQGSAGYLFVIARNLVRDRGRRTEREDRRAAALRVLASQLGETGAGLDELVFVEQAGECMRQALAELPERTRQAFLLYRVEGLSQREIAGRLGVTMRTVERDVAVTLAHLKRAVFSSETDDGGNERRGRS